MSSLVLTLTETLRYRGSIGQWSWVLHRLTGLGVVLFLVLHVVDTSWAFFYPGLYERAILSYQSPLFTLGEFGLVACVVYHAYNGLRIVVFDFKPEWWKHQARAAVGVLGLTVVTLVPVFALMVGHVLDHYGEDGVFILPLGEVIVDQLPFAVGMVLAVIAAIVFAAIVGAITGSATHSDRKGRGSKIERFWWSYMRVSGLLIVPLVFTHLAMMHVLQGVFDLNVAGSTVIGTGGAINASGTAVEFVANRWGHLIAGVAVWKLFDVALLALVTIHGFNGLRYVLTDYTMGNPILRRASIYVCLIGASVLLIVGAGALLGTIDHTAIDMAVEAQARIMGQ